MVWITGAQALDRLTRDCRFEEWRARRILNIAWEFGNKAEPCPGGYVHVHYQGPGDGGHLFSVVEHIGNTSRKGVPDTAESDYTQPITRKPGRSSGKATVSRKERTMPASRRARQADPEPAEVNGQEDYSKYLTKELTPTMVDYATWMDQNLPGWDKLEVDRILALGSTMYPKFQKSDFNIEQREARAAQSAPPAESEPAKPAARGGRRSGSTATAKPATGKPARAGTRGRAAATSGATPDAPF